MRVEIPHCPNCASKEVSRNGKTRHGKQNFKCRECGRQFVLNPAWKPLTEEQKELMSRMQMRTYFSGRDCSGASSVRRYSAAIC
ncbi:MULTISPECIES: IS1/IS1595 family N-terminal zinc-binding domain-containing protein [unclassified Microcoleus]|uniref:IS1/IS1595 family N-terminal zinc-binding domain-containing protein n=1 Tax=unclassified Microcoleus TaxID=2642155 RepID=UPI00403F1141